MPWIDDFAGTGCLADPANSAKRAKATGVVFAFVYRQPRGDDESLPGSTRLRFALAGRGFVNDMKALFPKAEVRVLGFLTEHELRDAWNTFAGDLTRDGKVALAGAIMSHATPDGIESRPGAGASSDASDDGTMKPAEIAGLAAMPWHAEGFLVLCGCRSALGSNPANATFSLQQGVPVLGQCGWAKFSSTWARLSPHDGDACQPPVYLWAYADRRNTTVLGAGGGDLRIPGKVARVHATP